jgi:hypothetical protein
MTRNKMIKERIS